ncbi:mechanosensitive ion channel domain-containing protein [Mycolicibacterium palauense]|uniref:mechanosensitive ion channel domain-containing protein n=1 Tax=Mycolicibacterium palauense TaxID=2034511 RepID=UPI000BFED51D|nr:mechanosensitive ion channel family protein [Mycolicibacterium palauense]
MTPLWESSWFSWSVAVAIGLPVGLVALTELHQTLVRRGSVLARPVAVTRTYLLPLVALLILMLKARDMPWHDTWVRVVATAVGFVVLVLALSGLKATLFHGAPEGSWRKRMPSIFLDVARFVLIAVGVALILAYVWGAKVGGVFTALGISSIVLGLILQNSVGQIISGLLMLFEQPFRLGDWLKTPTADGRVVEVNWRSVHIDTGMGLQITPNSVLAAASFTNLSRPAGAHRIVVATSFDTADPPEQVCALLTRVAEDLPHLSPGAGPSAEPLGGTGFQVSIPLRSPADEEPARAVYLRRLWYASRRAGLHLEGATDDYSSSTRRVQALAAVARTLRLTPADQRALVDDVRLVRYADDETIQYLGSVADSMKFVLGGAVRLLVPGQDGGMVEVRVLKVGDFIGATTLTREPLLSAATAIGEVTLLEVPRSEIADLVARKPTLLRDIGRAIEDRRREIREGRQGTGTHDTATHDTGSGAASPNEATGTDPGRQALGRR